MDLPGDELKLLKFLTEEKWPFHVNSSLTEEKTRGFIEGGIFNGPNNEPYWILSADGSAVGLLRIEDLDDIGDGYPLFDLRIRSDARGQGVGKFALSWMAKYIFEKFPQQDKIAGTTRADNLAMRKVFKSCGFAKEAHYRNDWPTQGGQAVDGTMYSLLRADWESGRTTPVNWNDETEDS
ncbi:MAG: N-acetyltransferase [Proteobacteria bacterium]|nr:MAG: N-acetyltransferase [Pseudomonadota bacterium]